MKMQDQMKNGGRIRDELSSVPAESVFILSLNHVESWKYMRQNFYDIIPVPEKFGNPSAILIMTRNLHWPETRNVLLENQKLKERP